MKQFPLTNPERIKLEVLLSMQEIQLKMTDNLHEEYKMFLMTIFGKNGLSPDDLEKMSINLQMGVLQIKEEGDDDISEIQEPKNTVQSEPLARQPEGSVPLPRTTTDVEGKPDNEPNSPSPF